MHVFEGHKKSKKNVGGEGGLSVLRKKRLKGLKLDPKPSVTLAKTDGSQVPEKGKTLVFSEVTSSKVFAMAQRDIIPKSILRAMVVSGTRCFE